MRTSNTDAQPSSTSKSSINGADPVISSSPPVPLAGVASAVFSLLSKVSSKDDGLDASVENYSVYVIGKQDTNLGYIPTKQRPGVKLIEKLGRNEAASSDIRVSIEGHDERVLALNAPLSQMTDKDREITISASELGAEHFTGEFKITVGKLQELEKTNRLYLSDKLSPAQYQAGLQKGLSNKAVISSDKDADLFEQSTEIVIVQKAVTMSDTKGNLQSLRPDKERYLASQAGIDFRNPSEYNRYFSTHTFDSKAFEQRMTRNYILTIGALAENGCINFAMLQVGAGPFLDQSTVPYNQRSEVIKSYARAQLRAIKHLEEKGVVINNYYLASRYPDTLIEVGKEAEFSDIRAHIAPTGKDIRSIAESLPNCGYNQAADPGTYFLGFVGNHFEKGGSPHIASEEYLANVTTMLTSNIGLSNFYGDPDRVVQLNTETLATQTWKQIDPTAQLVDVTTQLCFPGKFVGTSTSSTLTSTPATSSTTPVPQSRINGAAPVTTTHSTTTPPRGTPQRTHTAATTPVTSAPVGSNTPSVELQNSKKTMGLDQYGAVYVEFETKALRDQFADQLGDCGNIDPKFKNGDQYEREKGNNTEGKISFKKPGDDKRLYFPSYIAGLQPSLIKNGHPKERTILFGSNGNDTIAKSRIETFHKLMGLTFTTVDNVTVEGVPQTGPVVQEKEKKWSYKDNTGKSNMTASNISVHVACDGKHNVLYLTADQIENGKTLEIENGKVTQRCTSCGGDSN